LFKKKKTQFTNAKNAKRGTDIDHIHTKKIPDFMSINVKI
jgi:hypothetical protein